MLDKKKLILPIYKYVERKFSGLGLKKYSFIRKINDVAKAQLKSDFAIVQGSKMFLDSKDNLSLSVFGIYEPLETQLVNREINKDDIVIDIGANIGYYTLIFSKLVGKRGRVFAFEPIDYPSSILKKNIELNGCKNVIIEQKAISNENKKIKFQEGFQESTTLDDYFKNTSIEIDFIKMDIEGAEGLAIDGMNSILEENKNIKLMMEFHPIELKKHGSTPQDFLKKIRKFGFSIYNINNKTKLVEKVSDEILLKTYPRIDTLTNLFCKKE